jgi:hypothetical protein
MFRALFRRHEAENLKLLWRAARRAQPPDALCWRPLDPLASLSLPERAETVAELVDRIAATPFAPIAGALARTDHPAATEIGLDRWVWTEIWAQARALPRREAAALALVRLLVLEHDVDLLRRAGAFGVAPDLIAKATVVLSGERRGPGLLARLDAAAAWDGELLRLRRARLRACRRAFVGWPFQLAPAVAALLLREEQAFATLRIVAARRGLEAARDALPLALAAGLLEG